MPHAKNIYNRLAPINPFHSFTHHFFLSFLVSAILFTGTAEPAHGQQNDAENNTEKLQPADADTQFELADAPPVRRIVFFDSGIAQILHQGKIDGDQAIEIGFDRNQIDDVLKSLVFDNESGAIESVQYQPAPDKESLAASQLGPAMTLAQTLQKYRGETISIQIGGKTTRGSILGVETRTNGETSEDIVTLVTENGLETRSLADAQTIEFESAETQEQLRLAMVGLVGARDVERKTLTMFFQGQGKRKIQFGYVVDAPVWRMTYRLELGAEKSKLQGWAHVDNVTGFDFKNVYIDLKSGRPQAFNVELFLPLMAERPSRGHSVFGISKDLNLTTYFGCPNQRGGLHDGGNQGGTGDGFGGGGFGGGGFGGGGMGGDGGSGMGGGYGAGGFGGGRGGGGTFGGTYGNANDEEEVRQPMDITQGITVAGPQGRAARMIQFKIEKPINLASGHSAMLPILNQPVETELMTQFDLTRGDPTAELVVKVTNGKQYSMLAGPVTVLQAGQFVGDAELGRTDIGESAWLVYEQDQPVSMKAEPIFRETILEAVSLTKVNDIPTIVLDRIKRKTQVFRFINKDTEPRKILLKMSFEEKLVSPKAAKNKDGEAQFEFDVAADGEITKTIVLESPDSETKNLENLWGGALAEWKATDAIIKPEVEQLIRQYFAVKTRIDEHYAAAAKLKEQLESIRIEQERLTKMIVAIDSKDAVKPFVKKLTDAESRIAELKPLFEAAKQQLEKARVELDKITGKRHSVSSPFGAG